MEDHLVRGPRGGGGGDARLEFTARDDPRDYYATVPEPAVSVAGGGVRVDTRMTDRACQDLEAELDAGGRTLDVRVSIVATRTFRVCVGPNANYVYTARVLGLEPGRYRLRVRHVYPEAGRPDVQVLDWEIDVPPGPAPVAEGGR